MLYFGNFCLVFFFSKILELTYKGGVVLDVVEAFVVFVSLDCRVFEGEEDRTETYYK